ncbi:MAG: hypothetical protein AAB403_18670 [Planctomycetota bacterium]
MIGQHYYTRCGAEAGCRGFDGFQTRAKSRSITEEIDKAIELYVASYVWPRSLDRLEAKTRDLTPEEFKRTPESVHFYPIGGNRWGLTRARQHPRQSERGGNYFAHTLVLPLRALGAVDFNPFLILRSGVFRDSEGDAGKELPELSIGHIVGGSEAHSPSREVAGAAEVFRALVVKPGDRRSVVLLAASWEENAAIIENALLLLPPEYRASVAFSTYEPNPARLLGATERKPASHLVIGTIPRTEGGRFDFRDDQYKSFYLVNLPEDRTSKAVPACPEYAALAEEVLKGDGERAAELADVQRRIEQLGLTKSPEMWDKAMVPGPVPVRKEVKPPPRWAVLLPLAAALVLVVGGAAYRFGNRPVRELERQLASARKEIAQLRQAPAASTVGPQFARQLREALLIVGIKPRVEDGVVLVEFQDGLFSGRTDLTARGGALLAEVRKKLMPLQGQLLVDVEGHTDSRPVRTGAPWSDNYMLGFLRARVAEETLRAGDGLRRAEFRCSSVGPNRPVLGSQPADSLNRTVVLRLRQTR